MTKLLTALGLMSGTSMDGIDVALVKTDGEHQIEHGPFRSYAYPDDFRARLRQGLIDARAIRKRAARPGSLKVLERELTERHAAAVKAFLVTEGIAAGEIDVVGFHGQTVLHRPMVARGPRWAPSLFGLRRRVLTVQIGDGAALARTVGIDVVSDMRAADCAAGGEGAPLVPVYHRALTAKLSERPLAVLNVGGVANVTWIGGDGRLIAFDTGPGNALIDDWLLQHMGKAIDEDGRLARSGRVHEGVLTKMLRDPYFARLPPKSLDRNTFTLDGMTEISPADGAATLTAFTAAAVRRSVELMPAPPGYWLVSGGGRRNRTLMEELAARLDGTVAPIEVIGADGDAIEAEAWAYLAVRSLRGLPLTYPSTTGARRPTRGGVRAAGR
ncbi:MAG: anhydro-N-acetylmuramic acid kinase [Hyphomicrobiaceae bacterium]